MSIRTTDPHHVLLFDSVTGRPLNLPTFEDRDEAHAFLKWTDHNGWVEGTPTDLRIVSAEVLESLPTAWLTFLETHTEAECIQAYCGDDVDEPGWTNATDHEYNDGSPAMAHPNPCPCECHRRPGGRWSAERRGER